MEISIIVPVYNVKKYIEKCINSIISQTYKSFELILVDDGSTDNSGDICEKYAKEYEFIKVIHKKNGGLSSARNVAIDIAKGKYITFIDSDDYIENHYLEILYKCAKKNNSDIVISCLKDVNEKDKGNIDKIETSKIKDYNITKETTYKKMLLQEEIDVNATAKLYKKCIFEDIRYPIGKLYEDIQVIDKIIDKANIITYTNYRGYYYVQREGSIMYGKMSDERLVLIDCINRLKEKIEKEYPNINYAAIKRYVYCNYHILGRAIWDRKYNRISQNIRKNILVYKSEIFTRSIYSMKEKFATIVLGIGIGPYKLFWKMYCKLKNKKI